MLKNDNNGIVTSKKLLVNTLLLSCVNSTADELLDPCSLLDDVTHVRTHGIGTDAVGVNKQRCCYYPVTLERLAGLQFSFNDV